MPIPMPEDPVLKNGTVCPVSGLPIHVDPGWTLSDPPCDYRIWFSRIGEQILYRFTAGKASGPDAMRGNQLQKVAEASILKTQRHYVQIENFAGLNDFNLAARREYIRHFENRPHLAGLVFCGLSPLLSVNIRIAIKLYSVKFPVRITTSYDEAITAALTILADGGLQTSPKPRSAPSASSSKKPRIVTNPDWVIACDGYRADYHIIDGHIILAITKGNFKHPHVELTIEMQRRLMAKLDPSQKNCHFLADVSALEAIGYRVRMEFISAQNLFYEAHPFQGLIFCGASKNFRAAFHLGRVMAKFPIFLAKDIEESLHRIFSTKRSTHDDAKNPKNEPTPPVASDMPVVSEMIGTYVSDVLHYLSLMSVKTGTAEGNPIQIPQNHPFLPVFESIDLMMDDINELVERRIQNEKEKQELERKLALAQKMEALGLLAGGVAHDLNNVLSGITTYPQLLLLDLPQNHPMRKGLLAIQESGNKATAIVQDLLTLARRGVRFAQAINLNTIVTDYLDSSEQRELIQRYPNVNLALSLENPLPTIKGSKVHLLKTLMNLVNNGAEAQERCPQKEIQIITRRQVLTDFLKGFMDIPPDDYVVLTVADSGVGIEPQHLGRIFEPFYTKKEMGRTSGTGLGMTVVWGTVQDHAAYIDIDSEPGSGTQFSIYFPVCREPQYSEEEEVLRDPMQEYAGNGQTVLIIDDVPSQREIAGDILQRLGYSVTTVSGGQDAIAYLKKTPVDTLLLDMEMGQGLDGCQTYQEIITFRPGQKAVIASGFVDAEKVRKIQAIGAGQFLKKPYSIESLAKVIFEELHKPATP